MILYKNKLDKYQKKRRKSVIISNTPKSKAGISKENEGISKNT